MYKYQEALERAYICGDNDCCDCKFNEICINDRKGWYGTLKELVDKATPKKPYTKMNEHNHIDRHCPVCNSFVYSFDIYCGRCGQKMRSDEDDK